MAQRQRKARLQGQNTQEERERCGEPGQHSRATAQRATQRQGGDQASSLERHHRHPVLTRIISPTEAHEGVLVLQQKQRTKGHLARRRLRWRRHINLVVLLGRACSLIVVVVLSCRLPEQRRGRRKGHLLAPHAEWQLLVERSQLLLRIPVWGGTRGRGNEVTGRVRRSGNGGRRQSRRDAMCDPRQKPLQ